LLFANEYKEHFVETLPDKHNAVITIHIPYNSEPLLSSRKYQNDQKSKNLKIYSNLFETHYTLERYAESVSKTLIQWLNKLSMG